MIRFKPMEGTYEWEWFKRRTSVLLCEDTVGITAYSDKGVEAICVFDSFSATACNVHFAIENPLVIRAGFFREIADFAYTARGRTRMFGLVPDNNERALRLDKKIGFTEIARIPHAISEDVGYVVMELHRDDCRWRSDYEAMEAA